ncbi:MAG TPA: FAD-dependent monooxygenase [Candidatus Angelobacter sp.]|jgi:flavin-dependent dehydrogenase|nr:FAD-dependent monooxygenase [Candidatus Angelobacter sp.]
MGQIFDTDVFVVGGGPAGLAAAIAARQNGLRVMVADRAQPPIDKACGEGLMPDSLEALGCLGVSLQGYETGSFHGIRFVGPECSAAATFPQGRGLGIRRVLLHDGFVQHAQDCGVEMLWGARVAAIRDQGVLVNGRKISCRWLVGADGQNSQVRDWAGLGAGSGSTQRIGLRQHFQIQPWSDYVEIYWGSHGQAYVTPVGRNEVCVALISRRKFKSFDESLSEFPVLAARLQGAPSTTRPRGAMSISRKLKQVCRGNVALIGEASGSVDAITGEGLAMAFRQALALGPALAAGDLSAYAAAHSQINSLPEFMSRSMLLMDRSRWLRSRSLRAFARQPGIFGRMLAIHVGELQLRNFGVAGVLNLGWQLLVA